MQKELPTFHVVMKLEVQMKDVFQGINRSRKSNNLSDLSQQYLYHLDDVSLSFGKAKALQNVTLTVKPGEILFVTGKSGAGKTTLLNLLAGDIKPDSGRVFLPQRSQSFSAQVFQDLRLLSEQTCEENLWYAFDSKLYKTKKEFHEDMMELCKVLGIVNSLHVKISDVNGGMKQKIALVRSLLSRPNILLADEPTCSLDKESSIKIFEVLNFYNVKRNLTVIWASHNRDLVKQFPGKIVHLEKGKLIYSGHACFI